MNGRIYDPLIGRFLSADLWVQFPDSLQSFNRYSYVGNNPVTLIDPSGYATYEQNRDIGQNEVTSNWDPASHTFVFTTNKDGTLKDTYSWGNSANTRGWNKNQPEDRTAAQDALDKEKVRADAAANRSFLKGKYISYLDKKGDDDLDPFVEDAYNERNKPEHEHANWGVIKNCKAEASVLIDLARKKQEEAKAQAAAQAATQGANQAQQQGQQSGQTQQSGQAQNQQPPQGQSQTQQPPPGQQSPQPQHGTPPNTPGQPQGTPTSPQTVPPPPPPPPPFDPNKKVVP